MVIANLSYTRLNNVLLDDAFDDRDITAPILNHNVPEHYKTRPHHTLLTFAGLTTLLVTQAT